MAEHSNLHVILQMAVGRRTGGRGGGGTRWRMEIDI